MASEAILHQFYVQACPNLPGAVSTLAGHALDEAMRSREGVNAMAGSAPDIVTPVAAASSYPGAVVVGPDFFIQKNGARYAGEHLLLDLWDAHYLTDPSMIERALGHAARAAGATILHAHLHQFGEAGGVSGVVVLAESHISIHTWPEHGFVAIDVFMCGSCDPDRSVPVLREAFRPGRLEISKHRRGLLSDARSDAHLVP